MTGRRFASAQAKVRWAARKADEVRRRVDEYLLAQPITATPVEHNRSVDLIAHVQRPVPEEVALVVGEWAHSLRSALDHVVYAHVDDPEDQKFCAFPVWKKDLKPTPDQWAKTVRKAVPGERAASLRAHVETLQPYRNGNEEFLWMLTELDNIDKHRVTIDVVASIQTTQQVTQGHLLTERQATTLNPDDGMMWHVSTDQPFSHPLIKNPTMADLISDVQLSVVYADPDPEPVKDGDVIYTFTRNEWRDVLDITPQFHFVLGQEPFAGRPLLDEIDATTTSVKALLSDLARESHR